MTETRPAKKTNKLFIIGLLAFLINPIFGLIALMIINKRKKYFPKIIGAITLINYRLNSWSTGQAEIKTSSQEIFVTPEPVQLDKRKKYLQIALNSTLNEAAAIISVCPPSERIIFEVGTPILKIYGLLAIQQIRSLAPNAYLVADNKCADLAEREVVMMATAGANAATVLGVAPIETIDRFILACEQNGLDAMVDMMNVADPLAVLKKLKKPPAVVILHRGVDETESTREKQLPFYQIKQIKGNYKIFVAIAGGDTIKEIQQAIFNDADLAVVWKSVYQSSDQTAALIRDFLKEIK